jgi:hypothetical protein
LKHHLNRPSAECIVVTFLGSFAHGAGFYSIGPCPTIPGKFSLITEHFSKFLTISPLFTGMTLAVNWLLRGRLGLMLDNYSLAPAVDLS